MNYKGFENLNVIEIRIKFYIFVSLQTLPSSSNVIETVECRECSKCQKDEWENNWGNSMSMVLSTK